MIAAIPLRLGPLAPEGYFVRRSGLRWLCGDGQFCKAGQAIAYCNIGLASIDQPGLKLAAFADEARDFQVAFVLRVDGRVRRAAASSRGGLLDQLHHDLVWDPGFTIGHLECDAAQLPANADPLRLMLGAGRRVSEHAAVGAGFLTGWHDRSRAWWGDATGIGGTLLGLGSCDVGPIVRGESFDFTELLNAAPSAVQAILVPDDFLVPCARVVLEQVLRTPEQSAQIAADLATTFPVNSPSVAPADWIFAGLLMAALRRSPLTESSRVLVRGRVQRISGPQAVIMSLIAEPPVAFRHRRLGYTLCLHGFRLRGASELVRAWLRSNFEPVERDPSDIRRDYSELCGVMQSRPGIQFLVFNLMSSSAHEDVINYAQFDRPLGRTMGTVHAKELNLMLHDLAAEWNVAIVDIDAIAAEIGAAKNLPDSTHQSGAMQVEVRKEIFRILDRRRIPGFSAPRTGALSHQTELG